ncbi:hypothetical protein SAY86_031012 [Trapa natans]|uniref:Uncharacterized protein n=1 Tax=Trapa natans TaxID=22666 RepID=A0AAN7M3V0_TRANT|nr:hypothetical protein SAY86_031012 [Trapa natans]
MPSPSLKAGDHIILIIPHNFTIHPLPPPMAPQEEDDSIHFLLLPFMSQSHLIPFVDLAKLLAGRGHTVTLLLTPLNALRLRPSLPSDESPADPNLKMQFLVMPFPGEAAKRAVEEGGSSYKNITLMINHVRTLVKAIERSI